MIIAVACDHAGYKFKEILFNHLEKLRYTVTDHGCYSTEAYNYPEFAIPTCESVVNKKADKAILICGTGIGMCITANKIHGIRAALVYNKKTAKSARAHNDSNVLCIGAGQFNEETLIEFVNIWLTTEFFGGRHKIRTDMISKLEE